MTNLKTFEKLGKESHDFFEQNFNINRLKLDVTKKLPDTSMVAHLDAWHSIKGQESFLDLPKFGKLLIQVPVEQYGMLAKLRMSSDHEVVTDLLLGDKDYLNGFKMLFTTKHAYVRESGSQGPPQFAYKTGSVCVSQENKNFTIKKDLNLDVEKPSSDLSGTVKINNFYMGTCATADVNSSSISRFSTVFGYDAPGLHIHSRSNNLDDMSLSIISKMNASFKAGLMLNSTKQNLGKGTLCMQYKLNKEAVLKTKLNSSGELGMAFTYTIMPGLDASVSCSLVRPSQPLSQANMFGIGLSYKD